MWAAQPGHASGVTCGGDKADKKATSETLSLAGERREGSTGESSGGTEEAGRLRGRGAGGELHSLFHFHPRPEGELQFSQMAREPPQKLQWDR
jgi:hypothetical protein